MHIKKGKKIFRESKGVFIIAEISANHGQCFDKAVELVRKAKECGADAVKFQAYTPDTMTINIDNTYFHIKHPQWGGQTLYELYQKAYTPWEWFPKLKRIADESDIIFLCTAFDKTSIDILEELDICAHKISSFELVDLALIEYAAKTNKPIIISTGMGDIDEIQEAINTARSAGASEVILLKCVSSYPAKPEEMNLRTIPDMKNHFKCLIGLSDHSMGFTASICAASLGACVIEKHFTLSRKNKTPDSFFSIEPKELKELVENIRISEKAIGRVSYGLTALEKENIIFRRSLFVVRDVEIGDKVSIENVRSIRPGYGLKPKHLSQVIGRFFKKSIKKGTPLSWDMI